MCHDDTARDSTSLDVTTCVQMFLLTSEGASINNLESGAAAAAVAQKLLSGDFAVGSPFRGTARSHFVPTRFAGRRARGGEPLEQVAGQGRRQAAGRVADLWGARGSPRPASGIIRRRNKILLLLLSLLSLLLLLLLLIGASSDASEMGRAGPGIRARTRVMRAFSIRVT